MPEPVKDRCTKSHEYIFLLSKSSHYYFDSDAIKEMATRQDSCGNTKFGGVKYGHNDDPCYRTKSGNVYIPSGTRNKRDVWTVSTKPYAEEHFATFPEDLILPCILAGTQVGDTVLDPFSGAGTTGVVCNKHKRDYIGIELNPEYVEISNRRIESIMAADVKDIKSPDGFIQNTLF